MVTLCEQAEVALRERALRELKLVMAELYAERERAVARHLSHDGELSRRGWTTSKLATRVAKIECAMKELVNRCRRRSKDNLLLALAVSANEGKADNASGAPSAFKQLDKLGEVHKDRGARPWDLEAHGLEGLLDALEEGSICGGNEKLRLDAEAAVKALLKRLLQAALLTRDADILEEVGCDCTEALKFIELSSVGEIPGLIREVKTAMHHAALADVDPEDASDEFFDAIKRGDIEVVQWCLDREQVNPSSVDPRTTFPALVISARSGDLHMCELLMNRKADVNARCEVDGFCALHWAAHMRYARVVQALLAGRANPRLKDKKGHDPLMKLVRRDLNAPAAGCAWSWEMQPFRRLLGPELEGSGVMDLEDAKVAAENVPNCVGISFRSGHTYYASSGTWDIVGHEPEGKCHFSLHGPTMGSPTKSKKKKKKKKGGTNDETLLPGELDDALKAAVEGEEAEEGGEDEEDEDVDALWTTYLRVATNPAHDVIAMLAAGADACAQDNGGLSTMHHHLLSAPSRGSYQVIEALIRAQADVNVKDTTARSTTPLLLAVGARRADLLRLMIADAWPPADVDVMTSDGLSALALAEQRGSREVMEILKSAKASIWTSADTCIGSGDGDHIHSNIFCDTRISVGAEA